MSAQTVTQCQLVEYRNNLPADGHQLPSGIPYVGLAVAIAIGGLAGICLGIGLGIPVALHVGDIVAWLESLSGTHVFNPQVYVIVRIPSLLQWNDVLLVAGCGFVLSVLATIYPSRRAAAIEPAEVLRYE